MSRCQTFNSHIDPHYYIQWLQLSAAAVFIYILAVSCHQLSATWKASDRAFSLGLVSSKRKWAPLKKVYLFYKLHSAFKEASFDVKWVPTQYPQRERNLRKLKCWFRLGIYCHMHWNVHTIKELVIALPLPQFVISYLTHNAMYAKYWGVNRVTPLSCHMAALNYGLLSLLLQTLVSLLVTVASSLALWISSCMAEQQYKVINLEISCCCFLVRDLDKHLLLIVLYQWFPTSGTYATGWCRCQEVCGKLN